jgi:hypothetical protein
MIIRDLHLQSLATVAQVLGNKHSALLTNQEGRGICRIIISQKSQESRRKQVLLTSVAANIVRADGQISYLEVLDTVDVQALVEHAVLNNAVALFRGHGARLNISVW